VLIPDDDYRLTFRQPKVLKLQAVANETDVSRIRMEQVDGPVLGFFAIVTKRSGNLELESPFITNQEIWGPLWGSPSIVARKCI